MPETGFTVNVHPVPIPGAINSTDLGRVKSFRNVGGSFDGTYYKAICLFVPSTLQANLNIGQPYVISYSATAGQYYIPIAPAGSTTSGAVTDLGILIEGVLVRGTAPATGTYGWFAVGGVVQALVDGTTDVAVGDTLKSDTNLISGALVKSGTTITTQTVATALEARTANSAGLQYVLLHGLPKLNG